jgi:hypothetical protein
MSDELEQKKPETGIDAQAKDDKPDSRRKLIKAGIIGIPVILTLKGKPAWANDSVSTSGMSPAPATNGTTTDTTP